MGCLLWGAPLNAAGSEPQDASGLMCLEKESGKSPDADARMKVYLRGDDVQSVDWTSERGSEVVRREYRFHRRILVTVVETIHAKWDRRLGPLKHPRLVSTTVFNVEDEACARRGEFLQRAKQLMADFRERRSSYHDCGASRG